ncbi:PREDICTED: putative nuclease HARBI1 [Rhagoletis zephyria]|uniref:putative nuclease HARBI1 n=1 Tax=Rhagoletis zephyria TaxID=28612 RepID=UPI0008114F1E|nr:PREDICTED: putative nuclease HARBI1 [Rhagoletis zephyria]
MDPSLLFYLSSSDSENDERIVRKQLRDRSNPLALSNNAFIKRFRLSKEAFQYVLTKININSHDTKAVPAVLQLAASLSLLASGSYQHEIGSDYLIGMCQGTISKLTSNVYKEMENKLCPEFIRFDLNESQKCKEWFVEQYKIPGVIGCVDGTHIGLQKPTKDEHMFFNRKGFHSLNAMIICDHTYKILAINCQYGGAAHDSFVWKHSNQRMTLEERFQHNRNANSWLLGNAINFKRPVEVINFYLHFKADSGYPLEPWCITPYINPQDGSEEARFNEAESNLDIDIGEDGQLTRIE